MVNDVIISTEHLTKVFLAKNYGIINKILMEKPLFVRAVDDVNIEIIKGKTTALVGESGSGKTTLGRLLVTLERPTSGKIYFHDIDITSARGRNLQNIRARLQMVFQDPYSSLNPVMKIRDIIGEPLRNRGVKGKELDEAVAKMMHEVGLDFSSLATRRPSELSGGQRQRVAIARALITNPEFVVLDEPTSALDVSTQAQVLNLLLDLQQRHNLTYLLITHNIAVARYMSDISMIMYMGKIMEIGESGVILKEPLHPYTQALIESVPDITKPDLKPPTGEVGSLVSPPKGCRFYPRCPFRMDICKEKEPPMMKTEKDIRVSCWLYVKK
ncbi:ABC transporter ATP-binding protein [Vulcanisaeta souniana]|uniref:Dipeptide/oligopeptide/nickel ABC transporter ATP-binding protein n=1 Tax=Vulcanisaeta souniana JCM 11219 TaxID=1293586 RepID=A0A830E1P9_9CREN|nr:ABC transporter ATP-binding protein [Vulcanisaeta souniana]BDR91504.1 dipeptide/oligopeptide/nickel ABC transporter ATP-binding protein [Vulcanisaeta souniana JCM 11219]GGI73693.1 dipeptide/oligopeptide/nickel ABC transporter ATP-binding protein [Vulcanisaeta souniana JCM 11219]